jgi:hypothetical protein
VGLEEIRRLVAPNVAWAAGRETASRYVLAEWPVLSQSDAFSRSPGWALSFRSPGRSKGRACVETP